MSRAEATSVLSRPSRESPAPGFRELRTALSEPHPVQVPCHGHVCSGCSWDGTEVSVLLNLCWARKREVGRFDSKDEAVREVAIPARFSHVALPTHLDEL